MKSSEHSKVWCVLQFKNMSVVSGPGLFVMFLSTPYHNMLFFISTEQKRSWRHLRKSTNSKGGVMMMPQYSWHLPMPSRGNRCCFISELMLWNEEICYDGKKDMLVSWSFERDELSDWVSRKNFTGKRYNSDYTICFCVWTLQVCWDYGICLPGCEVRENIRSCLWSSSIYLRDLWGIYPE